MRKVMPEERGNQTYINRRRKMLSDFSFLYPSATPYISVLDCSENFLSVLTHLCTYDFSSLTTLNLSRNIIGSIEGLENCSMPILEKLYLYGNEIVDITPLISMFTPELKQLRLGYSGYGNYVKDMTPLIGCRFPKLQQLCLDCNAIDSTTFLTEVSFISLKLLYLTNNNIQDISNTTLEVFPSLEVLSLKGNLLTRLNFTRRVYLPKLQYINMANNKMKQIGELGSSHFPQLVRFDIQSNIIYIFTHLMKCDWKQASQISYYNFGDIYNKNTQDQIMKKYAQME